MDFSPLFISLRAAVLATIFAVFLGLICAWGVVILKTRAKNWHFINFSSLLDGFFTLPLVLPPTVLGFILLCIFGTRNFFGKILLSVGIKIVFDWKATVIASTVVAFPLAYRTLRASFEQLDVSIIYAARTLGLSERQIFTRIMIPCSTPGVVAGAILSFTRALGEFGATLMLAGDIPGRTETIPIAIWSASYGGENEKAVFWVFVIIFISFVCVFIMNKFCDGFGGQRK